MRKIEAEWLGAELAKIDADALSPVLEIGSSSLTFRTQIKPHIEHSVHAPLRARDVQIVTADLREDEGVEISGDVYDPATQAKLKAVGAKTLLMCNLFEHLSDPQSFADTCRQFVGPGGWIIVTVPQDYPYHLDPIDTFFRPSVADLHAMFPGTHLHVGHIITDNGYWSDLRKTRSPAAALAHVVKKLLQALTLRGGPDRARSHLSRMRYLFRPYKIAVVILKNDA